MIKMIYASDALGCIGKDNGLPWHLPSDLRRFKELTLGQIVVMGRKTYESLPERFRPLPGRTNVVVTKTPISNIVLAGSSVLHPNLIIVNSLIDYLKSVPKEKEVWIIGGATVYEQAVHLADEVYHTRIFGEYDGDAFFDVKHYQSYFDLASSEYFMNLPEDKGISYMLDIYKRKK